VPRYSGRRANSDDKILCQCFDVYIRPPRKTFVLVRVPRGPTKQGASQATSEHGKLPHTARRGNSTNKSAKSKTRMAATQHQSKRNTVTAACKPEDGQLGRNLQCMYLQTTKATHGRRNELRTRRTQCDRLLQQCRCCIQLCGQASGQVCYCDPPRSIRTASSCGSHQLPFCDSSREQNFRGLSPRVNYADRATAASSRT
jgi:hypothetical protein